MASRWHRAKDMGKESEPDSGTSVVEEFGVTWRHGQVGGPRRRAFPSTPGGLARSVGPSAPRNPGGRLGHPALDGPTWL